MPYYKQIISIFLLLAVASLVAGVISRALVTDWIVSPNAYLRFTGICLLFVIATSLAELAGRGRGPNGGLD